MESSMRVGSVKKTGRGYVEPGGESIMDRWRQVGGRGWYEVMRNQMGRGLGAEGDGPWER